MMRARWGKESRTTKQWLQDLCLQPNRYEQQTHVFSGTPPKWNLMISETNWQSNLKRPKHIFLEWAKDIVYSASMLDPDLNSQKKMIALYHSLEELLYSHWTNEEFFSQHHTWDFQHYENYSSLVKFRNLEILCVVLYGYTNGNTAEQVQQWMTLNARSLSLTQLWRGPS